MRSFLSLLAAVCKLCLCLRVSRLREKQIQLLNEGGFPLLDPPERIAGYFKLSRSYDAQMFYYFFQSRSDPQNDPLVLWLTGGPGCGAELAIFYENGPYHILDNLTLVQNEWGWDKSHNMIYLDQPVGTGFSYTDNPKDNIHDEQQVGEDVYEFLQEFLQAHPQYVHHEFFVTGESYGGHYVPAVSSKIFNANLNGDGAIHLNFKGFAIGDGYTNPGVQEGAYAPYLYMNGLITKEEMDEVNQGLPQCQEAIQACNQPHYQGECIYASGLCDGLIFNRLMMIVGNINYYDIRKQCVYNNLCYDFSPLKKYLDQPYVRQELGVNESLTFVECNNPVYWQFAADMNKNMDTVIPQMLDAGIRMNLYEGNKDFICNWLGNRDWVNSLNWTMSDQWGLIKDVEWTLPNGHPAGTVATLGPLQFTIVYDAGHLVPMDQPESAYHQIYYFTRNKPLVSPPVLSASHLSILEE